MLVINEVNMAKTHFLHSNTSAPYIYLTVTVQSKQTTKQSGEQFLVKSNGVTIKCEGIMCSTIIIKIMHLIRMFYN